MFVQPLATGNAKYSIFFINFAILNIALLWFKCLNLSTMVIHYYVCVSDREIVLKIPYFRYRTHLAIWLIFGGSGVNGCTTIDTLIRKKIYIFYPLRHIINCFGEVQVFIFVYDGNSLLCLCFREQNSLDIPILRLDSRYIAIIFDGGLFYDLWQTYDILKIHN